MRVVIDQDRCTGHGRCYVVAPALFSDDEAGFGQVVEDGDLDEGHRADADRAVNACPEQAVSIIIINQEE
jgi:ferredoxin